MLRDMMRLGCLLLPLLVGALAPAAEAEPRARGKVVRVERRRGSVAIPRICSVQPDGKAFCFGDAPAPNELITVLDQSGVVGEARVVGPTPFPGGMVLTCKVVWPISVKIVSGDLSQVSGQSVGVIGGDLHPRRARLVPDDALPAAPPGSTSEKVVLAIDGDADGTADIEFTESSCNGAQTGRGKCLTEWTRRGGQLTRALDLDISVCGF